MIRRGFTTYTFKKIFQTENSLLHRYIKKFCSGSGEIRFRGDPPGPVPNILFRVLNKTAKKFPVPLTVCPLSFALYVPSEVSSFNVISFWRVFFFFFFFTRKKYDKVRVLPSLSPTYGTTCRFCTLIYICFFSLLGIGDSGHHTPDFGTKRNQERSTQQSTGSHLYNDMRRILVSGGRSRVADPDPHYFGKSLQDPH